MSQQQIVFYTLVLVSILVIIALGMLANFLVRRSLRQLVRRQYISEPLSLFLQGLVRWVIMVAVVLVALQQLGVRLIGIWAGLLTVAGMVAIGFIAVWSVLSNILCSVLLIIFAPFRIGDDIEIVEATGGKGLRGRVVNLNILYTSLQESPEGEADSGVTYVPNNIFFQKTLRRWRGTDTSSLDTSLFKQPADTSGADKPSS
jgi:small-conductance mechanosensitive channel